MKKIIFLIRHGQTDLNLKGIVQGRGIDSPLNEKGQQQALAFYQAYKNVGFDKIYVSHLKRTYQTVEPFIRDGIPVERLAGLDEISWGVYEGQEQSPEISRGFELLTGQWNEGNLDLAVEGGESPSQVVERQKAAINYILSFEEEKQILICMHGRAMRILLCWLSGVSPKEMDSFQHTNTSLYKLTWDGDRFEIVDHYNIRHLEA